MIASPSMKDHFSLIAPKYKSLRTTDLEPVLYIKEQLKNLATIQAADIGCGSGRYPARLLQHLRGRLHFLCVDYSQMMLRQLTEHLTQQGIKAFQAIRASAMDLPVRDAALDCVLTFNAIHHFEIPPFFREANRVLKDGGYLFIYTRLRSQNSRNIWGTFFPMFASKESRLYEMDELQSALAAQTPRLEIRNMRLFRYERRCSLTRLVEQATHFHYSTFRLYAQSEFKESLEQFKGNIQQHFDDLNNVTWADENILLVIRKTNWDLTRQLP
jgi:ubiquinone/menaquinone biosynthesis C-methylase UbiE